MKELEKFKGTSLIKPDQMTEKFKAFIARIKQFNLDASRIDVNDDDTMTAAKTQIDNGKTIVLQIETLRKEMKAPYMETGKHIDAYAKIIAKPLNNTLENLRNKNKNYLEIKAAQARADEAKKKEEEEKIQKEKDEELFAFNRISDQLNVRLFGGTFHTKDGQSHNANGCKTPEDCNALQEFVNKYFPNPDDYKYYSDEFKELKKTFLVDLAKYHASLVENKEVSELQRRAQEQREVNLRELAEKREKEAQEAEKQREKEIQGARKGLRKVLKFKVEKEDEVPVTFKTVDTGKIKEYIKENGEKIRTDMEKSKVSIPGIRFFYENIYTNR